MHSVRRGSIGPRVWVWGRDVIEGLLDFVVGHIGVGVRVDLVLRLATFSSEISVWSVAMELGLGFEMGVENVFLLVVWCGGEFADEIGSRVRHVWFGF